MPVAGGGLFSGALLGALGDSGTFTSHGRRVNTAAGKLLHYGQESTAFVRCEDDPKPKPLTVAAPSCLENGEDCSAPEDLKKLQNYSAAVDDSLQEDLQGIKKAREKFLRRACDYQYAMIEDKGELLENTYGPKGPLLPGGSYLFELRRWADQVFMLYRQCNRGMGGCQGLVQYLKDHPADDIAPGGVHGKAGSNVYSELRLACEVGRSRAPVPNDGPVWCSTDTGLCEQKSCKKWWRKKHFGKNDPWVDDRLEYDDLKEACSWISHHSPSSREINRYQGLNQEKVLDLKTDNCRPKWIEGYCPDSSAANKPRFGQCTLEDGSGKWCKNGRIFANTENDDTGTWKEPFKEKAVTVDSMPDPTDAALLTHAMSFSSADAKRQERSNRYGAFL